MLEAAEAHFIVIVSKAAEEKKKKDTSFNLFTLSATKKKIFNLLTFDRIVQMACHHMLEYRRLP